MQSTCERGRQSVKYHEWMVRNGFGPGGFYSEIHPAMAAMLDGDTEVLASVLDKREDDGPYNWKKSFILLTQEQLVTGHIGYRNDSEEGPEGLVIHFSVSPVRAVASVTIDMLRIKGEGRYVQKAVVEFAT